MNSFSRKAPRPAKIPIRNATINTNEPSGMFRRRQSLRLSIKRLNLELDEVGIIVETASKDAYILKHSSLHKVQDSSAIAASGVAATKKAPERDSPELRGGYLLFHFRSIIGVARFNFSVRNGKRWNPRAMATLMLLSSRRSRLS